MYEATYSSVRPSDQDEKDLYDAPPPYRLEFSGELLSSSATILDDGRLDISFLTGEPNQLESFLPPVSAQIPSAKGPSHDQQNPSTTPCPRLNLVIQVVGSRGDVQPFIAYGTALQRYGHRVRIATHDVFAEFVRNSGLEFYSIGGDPTDLMAYMVRNPGLIPSLESLRDGDIGRKRRMVRQMLEGCWESCFCPDDLTGELFIADAIIANPPSFAHVHCAQALSIPLHIVFTMPWTATRAFPHPLANLRGNNTTASTTNWLSYGVVETMTWQGRCHQRLAAESLGLEEIQASMGPGLTTYLKVPHTYCWSPSIMHKPADWGPEIDVCGFFMRDEPPYTPSPELSRFLESGPAPIYVGFGSIVLDDPQMLTDVILETIRRCGVRVIISRGWSKLGGDSPNTDRVFYLDDCPHEWLFKRVSVVIHHGGAGTTACGLANARPTIIVPFFGDQPFWGEIVANIGAGSRPIPQKRLSVNTLLPALQHCLSAEVNRAAQRVASKMRTESGVQNAVKSFHRNLPLNAMTCDVLPHLVATWWCKKKGSGLKLSDAAAATLIAKKKLKESDVQPLQVRDYNTDVERWEPLTGGASSVIGTLTDMTLAFGGTFVDPFQEYKRHRNKFDVDGMQGSKLGASNAAATSVVKNLGKFSGAITRGVLVDMPVAFTEGIRNMPKLYGAKPDDYGRVQDWKSGAVVGAKALGLGMYNGFTGIVSEPYRGAKEEGTVGFLKGLGKGCMNMVTKPTTASIGLFVYPVQGIYKSMIFKENRLLRQQKEAQRNNGLPSLNETAQQDIVRIFEQFSEGN